MSAWAPKVLLNGNIEVTVELMPEIYAALTELGKKGKVNYATMINAAIGAFAEVVKAAEAQGTDLLRQEDS